MSLTGFLARPESELSQFFESAFPRREAFLKRYGQTSPPLVVEPREGANPGTVGTAFDFLVRFELDPNPDVGLAMQGAALAGQPFIRLLMELAERLRAPDVAPASASHSDHLRDWPRTGYLVCRASYLLALFTEVYRSGAVWPGSLLSQATKRTKVRELLAMVPAGAVEDLQAMLVVARAALVPAILARGEPLHLGPVFDGSRLVSADADIIAGGLLLDVKTTVGTKRSDGSRYDGLERKTLYQLLGYVLFDFSDTYAITDIGLYAARYGRLTTWPVADVLAELTDDGATLSELRRRCEKTLRALVM
jgi:hypothetical protein